MQVVLKRKDKATGTGCDVMTIAELAVVKGASEDL